MMNTKVYDGVGVMSGTSLDGLDLAWCSFQEGKNGQWQYEILKADTIPYTSAWRQKLRDAMNMNAYDYALLDVRFGTFIGETIRKWLGDDAKPQFIASHGHTVFHRPELHLTAQIGSGAAITAVSGIQTICDFRTTDVALGGQGAPLVPIGDELLFGKYDACLNLGGIANISFRYDDKRISFDICPCNIPLNAIAMLLGLPFDKNGQHARKGSLIHSLFDKLETLPYYQNPPPKSLGREWVESSFNPQIAPFVDSYAPDHILHTITQHIATRISDAIPEHAKTVLITGGGALNNFLIERLQALTASQVIVPEVHVVQYKEALVFAFLGLLRILNRDNCLKSVTGASRDNCGGAIYL